MNSVYAIYRQQSCDFHRIINPLRVMGVDLEAQKKMPYADAVKQFPIVTLNRIPQEGISGFLERKRRNGFKLVVDIDDFWHLDKDHYLYKHWMEHKIGQRIITMLKAADVVTTTSSTLASKAQAYNDNIVVIPNALPFREIDSNRRGFTLPVGVTRFIYAAGASHAPDVQELYEPLWSIATDDTTMYGGRKAEIRLAGVDTLETHRDQWDYMRKILNTFRAPHLSYSERESMPLSSYLHLYETADVALAPLKNTVFNNCKSNLKTLEAGAYNLPIIASGNSPYDNPVDKDYVTVAYDKDDWFDFIRQYTRHPNRADDDGRELGRHVRANYELTKVNETRVQLYNVLLDKIR
jgi:glycosyltransferase involved in cell wall biosynthesis